MTPEVEKAKAAILKKRRQRIRETTYRYVADAIIEDTAPDQPFRDKMVVSWWARVLDPLEAETYDAQRLRYFRERLHEHAAATKHNADIRQGKASGEQLRRLSAAKFSYVRRQVKRIADPKVNYAAAKRAVQEHDQAYERLVIGLIMLPRIAPRSPDSFLFDAAVAATSDHRFDVLRERLRKDREVVLPGMSRADLERRIELLSDPGDVTWYPETDFQAEQARAGLIRKLEDIYVRKIR